METSAGRRYTQRRAFGRLFRPVVNLAAVADASSGDDTGGDEQAGQQQAGVNYAGRIGRRG